MNAAPHNAADVLQVTQRTWLQAPTQGRTPRSQQEWAQACLQGHSRTQSTFPAAFVCSLATSTAVDLYIQSRC